MENKQKPTIEEVLIKHYELMKSEYPPDTFFDWDDESMQKDRAVIVAFAKEWAAIETEQLRQENKTLWEKSGELVNHFITRTKLELEQPNKIYLQADVSKGVEVTWCEDRIDETDVCYIRIDAYAQLEQENKTLKEQQRTLHVEVNSDSLAAAHYEKEIERLKAEISTLKAMHSAELKMRQEAEDKICDARANLILGNTETAFKSLGK